MEPRDLDMAIQRSHAAVAGVFRGDPMPAKALFSGRDDVMLGAGYGKLDPKLSR
jgi:hypothetical protein